MNNTIVTCEKLRASTPVWLTEQQVASLIGCSLSKLQKDRHECKGLTYTKFGRSVRYALEDVHEFMHSNRVNPLQ